MKVTIEHSFCPYCDEVTELYFRIINTILFSTDETELRTGMEHLQAKTHLDDYFVFGYGKHHYGSAKDAPAIREKFSSIASSWLNFDDELNSLGWDNHPTQTPPFPF